MPFSALKESVMSHTSTLKTKKRLSSKKANHHNFLSQELELTEISNWTWQPKGNGKYNPRENWPSGNRGRAALTTGDPCFIAQVLLVTSDITWQLNFLLNGKETPPRLLPIGKQTITKAKHVYYRVLDCVEATAALRMGPKARLRVRWDLVVFVLLKLKLHVIEKKLKLLVHRADQGNSYAFPQTRAWGKEGIR